MIINVLLTIKNENAEIYYDFLIVSINILYLDI